MPPTRRALGARAAQAAANRRNNACDDRRRSSLRRHPWPPPEAARASVAMLPLARGMKERNGDEKKKELLHALPTGTADREYLLLRGTPTVVVF